MGRPTKLTPTRSEQILKAIKASATREVSARAAGVGVSTLYAWLERGRAEESGDYRDFLDAVDRAEAEAEVTLGLHVRRAAAEGEWRAALAILERRHPERWARPRSEERGERAREERPAIDLTELTEKELRLLEGIYER